MSGWCPSSSVYSIEWRWCVLLLAALSSGAARALLIPVQYSPVLLLCRVPSRCQVCGAVRVSVCVWCSCGGVSSDHSPLVVVVGGAVVDGGAWRVVVGGIAVEGRWCQWLPLLSLLPLPFSVGVPLLFARCPLLNGGCVVCCGVPVFGWVWHFVLSCPSLASPCPSMCSLLQHCWFRGASL